MALHGATRGMTTLNSSVSPTVINKTAAVDPCPDEMVDISTFYLWTLIPAILISISFSFTQKRRRMFLDRFSGRPGLVHPMDILTKSDRLAYVCALGATATLLLKIIMGDLTIVPYDGPPVMKTLMILVSVVIIGMVYYPVFGCLTAGSMMGFGVGSVYVWMLTLVQLVKIADCKIDAKTRTFRVFINLPCALCLLCLSVQIPYKFYKNFQYRKGLFSNLKETKQERVSLTSFKRSNIGLHIGDLLRKPEKEKPRVGFLAKLFGLFLDLTYRPIPRFRYSARFLSTISLMLILIYAASLLLFWSGSNLHEKLDKIISLVKGLGMEKKHVDALRDLVGYVTRTLMAATILALFVGLYSILALIKSYRETMIALNRGQLKHLTEIKTNNSILLAAMKYSGFQIISGVFGFFLYFLICLVVCGAISGMVWAFEHGYTTWLKNLALQYWPIIFWSIIIMGSQNLMTKFAFVGHKTHLVLNNRRMLFIVSYFIFFYNMFLGLFSWLLRLVMSTVIGAAMLPRYDFAVLPRAFESWDPGYNTYVAFTRLENDHTHPVMLGFIRLLQILAHERRDKDKAGRRSQDDSSGINEAFGASCGDVGKKGIELVDRNTQKHESPKRRRIVIFKWQTAYTLINNPDLRMHRKGYVNKLKRAKQLGVALPKSDTYIDISDDIMLIDAAQQENGVVDDENNKQTGGVFGRIASAAGNAFGGIKSSLSRSNSYDDLDQDVKGGGGGSQGEGRADSSGRGDNNNGGNDETMA